MITKILVTGASGVVGSRLTGLLARRGADVRALVRRSDAVLSADPRIRPVSGDFADPSTLAAAMAGVDAVFLACGNVPEQVGYESAVIAAAAHAGVSRLVKLSARGADLDASVAFWRWHAEIEAVLQMSGIPSVILRPGFSMANLYAAAEQVRGAGLIAAPLGDARIAMVDPADVAAVAAECLVGGGRLGHTYTLTGAEAIGYEQVADALSRVTGRSVRYVDVPSEAAVGAMTAAGLPQFAAEQIAAVFASLRAGAQQTTTEDVSCVIGRQPRSFAEFAVEVAPVFGALAGSEPSAALG